MREATQNSKGVRVSIWRNTLLRAALIVFCVFILMPMIFLSAYTSVANGMQSVAVVKVTHNAVSSANHDDTFKVVSVNLAHGRANGRNQILLPTSTILSNINTVANYLEKTQAHVVCLQEADAPSWWSGGINQVESLASKGGFSHFIQGLHVQGLGLSYGTGIISWLEMEASIAYTFSPSWPTFSKGFSLSSVNINGRWVDIVSVHLDFSRASVRAKQVREMHEVLSQRKNPLVVVGDFNSEWSSEVSALKLFATMMGLNAYKPESARLVTFKTLQKRLDWVLISDELAFVSYTHDMNVSISDHQPIVVELQLL